jgi:hypothetical protein
MLPARHTVCEWIGVGALGLLAVGAVAEGAEKLHPVGAEIGSALYVDIGVSMKGVAS